MSDKGFTIPERFLKSGPRPMDPEQSENGLPEGGNSSYLDELVEFSQWVTKTADDFAKERGYPGTGHVPPDQLGELMGRIADKRLPEWLKSKTQDATGVGLITMIIADNYLHHRKVTLQQPDQKQENESENKKEE